MLTLTQLQQDLQELLCVTARQAGRESGFIQRERNLSGASFVSGLVWGWMANPEASLSELSQSIALCGSPISPQGLAQRMTMAAATCLRQVLEASLELVASGGESSATFLQQFNGVYLLDSTEVVVPAEWEPVWSGGGNQHQRRAALKVQTLWDYAGGRLHFSLHPARRSDVALPVASIPSGAVRVTDSGYFEVNSLQQLQAQGSFYLTRVPCKVRLFDESGRKWRLSEFLQRWAAPHFDGEVTLTARGLRCRLLAQRVPDTIAAQRQARLRQTARRKRDPLSQEALALAHWTIVVTNLSPRRLTFDHAFMLLRLRWQIELLFKLWKQHAHLETSRSQQPDRIMCELYAKLLGLVIQHALLLTTCWDVPNQSLVKLAQTVRKSAFLLAVALWTEPSQFDVRLTALRLALRSGCRLDTRKAQPSHFQRLLSLS